MLNESQQLAEIYDTLVACEEYFEDRADADYEGDPLEAVPNEAMKMLSQVREVLESKIMRDTKKAIDAVNEMRRNYQQQKH